MSTRSAVWPIVLAAGDGCRLQSLTRDPWGVVIPKQFCSLTGETSLLGLALRRAGRLAPRDQIVAIVAEQHEQWWQPELQGRLRPANVISQPGNRGTAPGILLPLLHVYACDPEASVVILPSDHYVAEESLLHARMDDALAEVQRSPERLALLGIAPDQPDPELGWIVPGDGEDLPPVSRFVEKPSVEVADELMRRGGLWNSFVVVARARSLLALFRERTPRLWSRMTRAWAAGEEELRRVYADLETNDFCRDLLQGSERRLVVCPVPPCGWSDLGTPERVAGCLERLRSDLPFSVGRVENRQPRRLSLDEALRRVTGAAAPPVGEPALAGRRVS